VRFMAMVVIPGDSRGRAKLRQNSRRFVRTGCTSTLRCCVPSGFAAQSRRQRPNPIVIPVSGRRVRQAAMQRRAVGSGYRFASLRCVDSQWPTQFIPRCIGFQADRKLGASHSISGPEPHQRTKSRLAGSPAGCYVFRSVVSLDRAGPPKTRPRSRLFSAMARASSS